MQRLLSQLPRKINSHIRPLCRPISQPWLFQPRKLSTEVPGYFHLQDMEGESKAQRYRIQRKIGTGETSVVWLAKDLEKQQWVAVKILSHPRTFLDHFDIHQELEVHTRINENIDEAKQSNCITLLDSFYTLVNKEHKISSLCLVLPLMRANLDDVIKPNKKPIPISVTKKVLRSVLKGLRFLHRNGIMHREITTKDVLIKMDPQFDVTEWLRQNYRYPILGLDKTVYVQGMQTLPLPQPTISELTDDHTEFVLSDFGNSATLDRFPVIVDAFMPMAIRPPETFLCDWDCSADIWNLGVMAYYLLTRKPLFSNTPTRAQLDSLWPPPLRPPQIKRALENGLEIPQSLEWFFYQWSSLGKSDLPVGSFPRELTDSGFETEYKEGLKERFFDEQGRLRAFTWPDGKFKEYGRLKRSSFLELLESTHPPMSLKERKGAAEFLDMCVQLEPEKRPSAAELLEHDWLKV